ncbi:MAG TPA: hypothetical protein VFW77_04820 [Candidatus Saccharimonadales bacterium]|nr:hypothetical protein [Candidatus Saccharimonadales bacterium]
MGERVKTIEKLKSVKNVITRPRSALAILLMAGTAIAGCGNTISASDRPVGACGSHEYSAPEKYSKAVKKGYTEKQVLALAKRDVLILQHLALRVGGDIDLPRDESKSHKFGYVGDVTEITATPDNLRLNFNRNGGINTTRVDHVDFPISGDSVDISEGSVMCYDNEDYKQLVTNGTYTALQSYVQQTSIEPGK